VEERFIGIVFFHTGTKVISIKGVTHSEKLTTKFIMPLSFIH